MSGIRLLLALAAFSLVSVFLESIDYFSALRGSLQQATIPSRVFQGRGKLRTILMRGQLFAAQPSKPKSPEVAERASLGNTSLFEYRVRTPYDAPQLPSTSIAVDSNQAGERPTISIAAIDEHLYGSRLGIFSNPTKRGRGSERPVYVSYFDEAGRLIFQTLAGVRIHGGETRREPHPGLRITFREQYGLTASPAGAFFAGTSVPLSEFIIRNESWFTQPLAFDIAEQVGCIVPKTQPVQLLINGRRIERPYFVTERLTHEFVARRLGHTQFIMIPTGELQYSRLGNELFAWANNKPPPPPLTLQDVAEKIDVDNFFAWCISISFCATGDFFEGPVVFQQRDDNKRVVFVNWDMDWSFGGHSSSSNDGLNLLTRTHGQLELRTVLFERLMAEDPAARRYFAGKALCALNHQLTASFLNERLQYYRSTVERFDFDVMGTVEQIESFLKNRREEYRNQLQSLVELGSFHQCTVDIPDGESILIDGFEHKQGIYQGHYVPGSRLVLGLPETADPRHYAWTIGDDTEKATGTNLVLNVDANLTIRLSRLDPAG